MTNITVSSGSTTLWEESYAYNAAGERVSTTRSNSSASYQYDGTYQLIRAISGSNSASWSYDGSGNRTSAQSTNGTNTLSVSYSVNEINQYTSVGEASPSYNSRGDLSGINGWAFSYDAFGNLSAAQYGTNAAYHYARDPLGRRAIRQSGSNTILLLNAGDTMLEAYNASSNSVSSYIYEPGIDRPLAQVLSNGSIRYVHQDVLGSVVMLTDSNGAPYQSYSYDAWGKVTARDAAGSVIASSAISAPWLFTGRRFDKESGLYHYRARTYSAELGRFLQMDPIKFDAGDPNIFRYVGNDPVNGTDPWGLAPELNLFPTNQQIYQNAKNYNSPTGTYSVGAHGDPQNVYGPDGQPISPGDLANMIKGDPNYKPGEPVNLNSCNTGKGNNPYAQQLAKALQAPVNAPNQYDWYYPNGTVAPYPALNGNLSQGPDLAHPGQVRMFNPR